MDCRAAKLSVVASLIFYLSSLLCLYFRLAWVGMKPSLCKDQPDSFYFSAGEVRVCVGDT